MSGPCDAWDAWERAWSSYKAAVARRDWRAAEAAQRAILRAAREADRQESSRAAQVGRAVRR